MQTSKTQRTEDRSDGSFGEVDLHGMQNGLAVLALRAHLLDDGVAIVRGRTHGSVLMVCSLKEAAKWSC